VVSAIIIGASFKELGLVAMSNNPSFPIFPSIFPTISLNFVPNPDPILIGPWMSLTSNEANADAVAMADILHYNRAVIGDIRSLAENEGLSVRHYE